jgi:hypothetical protein
MRNTTLRARHFVPIAVLMTFAALAAGVVAGGRHAAWSAPEDPGADEQAFVDLVNQSRTADGLPPLRLDPELAALARDWAAHMATDGAISHANPLQAGVTSDWQKLGENVGKGPATSPVMDAFLASPTHRANLLDPTFTRIGVGVVWRDGALFTVHRFSQVIGDGAPAPAPPAPNPAPAPAAPAPSAAREAPPPPTPPPPPPSNAPTTSAPPSTLLITNTPVSVPDLDAAATMLADRGFRTIRVIWS